MNNKTILLFIFILCLVVPAYSFEWTNCGTSTDDFVITNITIKPDPPVKGENSSINAVGTMKKIITSGTSTLQVKYGFITVLSQTSSICTAPVVCPIPVGPFDGALPPVGLPAAAPNGNYKGGVKITDQDGDEVACITFEFTLS